MPKDIRNMANHATAEEVEGLDVLNSEEDNKKAFELLYKKWHRPWTHRRLVGQKKITMPGGIIVALEAQTGSLSEPFNVPLGFKFAITGNGNKYRAKFVGFAGETATINVGAAGSNETIPWKVRTIQVQSLEQEAAIVKITLTPKT